MNSSVFDQVFLSIRGRSKPKNGDSVVVEVTQDPQCVLVIVADGVGSRPCDWLASKTACEFGAGTFRETAGTLRKRVQESILQAHTRTSSQTGACEGMLAAVALIAWRVGTSHLAMVNIGDTRIYKIGANAVTQISEDDSMATVRRVRGKIQLSSGSPQIERGITKAVGQKARLDFEVQEHEFLEGEALVLATDGAYAGGGAYFATQILALTQRSDLSERILQHLLEEASARSDDDASAAVLRRCDVRGADQSRYRACLRESTDWRQQNLHAHMMVRFVIAEIQACVGADQLETAAHHLDYIEKWSLRPSQAELIAILDAVARIKSTRGITAKEVALFNRVRHMLGRTMRS